MRDCIRQSDDTDDAESVVTNKNSSKSSSKFVNRNANVWANFDWSWFRSIMDEEVKLVRTRIPDSAVCKRKWKRNRWESVSVDDVISIGDASDERVPKRSIFADL